MTTTVKDLLHQHLPPTRPDQIMTRVHTNSSVEHNLRHIKDHAKGLMEAIEKMRVVDEPKAKAVLAHVLKEVEKVRAELDKLDKGDK